MKVNFFNTPYVLYEGEMKLKIIPFMLTATEHHVGSVYSKKHLLPFSIYIYNCLYEYDK